MKEFLAMTASSDTVTAQQYADSFRRGTYLEPEKYLLIAILDDAVHDYRKYKGARDHCGRRRFRAADAWIMAEANDWIFDFNNVCVLLGLDPHYVRRRIRESAVKVV